MQQVDQSRNIMMQDQANKEGYDEVECCDEDDLDIVTYQ